VICRFDFFFFAEICKNQSMDLKTLIYRRKVTPVSYLPNS
jgi:hypothetical protein